MNYKIIVRRITLLGVIATSFFGYGQEDEAVSPLILNVSNSQVFSDVTSQSPDMTVEITEAPEQKAIWTNSSDENKYTNRIGFTYELITFMSDYPVQKSWNTLSAEYQKYIGKSSVIGRLTYSERFFDNSLLYELESYPVLSEKLYGYINVGFSNGDFFQKFGASVSIYQSIKGGYEFEFGGRYLEFEADNYLAAVVGITKYIANFYINGRAFLGPEKLGTLIQNYQLNIRYYLNDSKDYLLARLGSGISPDDRSRFTQINANPNLKAYYTTLGISKTLQQYRFQVLAGYLLENLSNQRNGNQLLFSAGLSYQF